MFQITDNAHQSVGNSVVALCTRLLSFRSARAINCGAEERQAPPHAW